MRGLRHVAERLKAAGHIVVEWQGDLEVGTTLDLTGRFWGADGGTASESSAKVDLPDLRVQSGRTLKPLENHFIPKSPLC
jgi:hypothetical protein